MSINTITQPIFKVDLYSELATVMTYAPDRCLAWVEGDQRFYILESGVWFDFVDIAGGQVPRVWQSTTRKSNAKTVLTNANVAGGAGVVTFNISDANANAILANVYKEGCAFWIDSPVAYQFSSFTVAADRKTLSVKVTYPVIAALLIVYSNAPNGTTVNLMVNGD